MYPQSIKPNFELKNCFNEYYHSNFQLFEPRMSFDVLRTLLLLCLNILCLWPLVVDSDIWNNSSIGMSSIPFIILKTCIRSARLRLYKSVGTFYFCSLSLYDKCIKVKQNLVACLCTFSIVRMWFFSTGNQIKAPVIYTGTKKDYYPLKTKVLFISLSIRLALFTTKLIWSSNLRLSWIVIWLERILSPDWLNLSS